MHGWSLRFMGVTLILFTLSVMIAGAVGTTGPTLFSRDTGFPPLVQKDLIVKANTVQPPGPGVQVAGISSPLFKKSTEWKQVYPAVSQPKPLSLPGFNATTVPVTPKKPVASPLVPLKTPGTILPVPTPTPSIFKFQPTGTPLLKPGLFPASATSLPKIPFPPLTPVQVQPETPAAASLTSATTRTIEERIFYYTNLERTRFGMKPYLRDTQLAEIARDDAIDMAVRGFFDHINPDGESPTDRARKHGYPTQKDFGSYYRIGVGENIAMLEHFTGTPEEVAKFVVEAWMNSPGHRANILDSGDSGFTNLGVGVAYDPVADKYLAAQEFF